MSARAEKNTPICITGGSGFIGRHLVQELVKSGYAAITIIDHNRPAAEYTGKIRFFKGNFADKKILSKALTKDGIVIHLAGTSNQATAEKDPVADAETSIVGTLTLLQSAAEKGISKFIFLSSAPAVYGESKKLPVDTDTLPRPRSAYGAMKLALEHYVRHYAERYGFSYAILRSANAYGPGQFAMTHGVVSKFAYKILKGERIEIWGSPKMKRDFIFVEDIAHAIASSLDSKVRNVTLNVGSGKGTTFSELIREVEKASGIKANVSVKEMRLIDVPDMYFSIKGTTRELSWKPTVSLRKGVERTVAWIRDVIM
jgi:UDP-glucose 4-epimerase